MKMPLERFSIIWIKIVFMNLIVSTEPGDRIHPQIAISYQRLERLLVELRLERKDGIVN